ncbi:uncharacterized protein METZ01_LOCUS82355 [marine metagenome]|uniref:Uncharacterized protein n=1 Tax=marine metagenome TaxID=408172 RepID=A0A381UP23_9ZZZZ
MPVLHSSAAISAALRPRPLPLSDSLDPDSAGTRNRPTRSVDG